jgi:hypothetical protein
MNVIEKLPKIDNIICHIDYKNKIPKLFSEQYQDKIIYENIDTNIKDNDFSDINSVCFDVCHSLKFGNK